MKQIILVLTVLAAITCQAQLKPEYQASASKGAASAVFNVTANPDIPSSITFAGEKVDFDRLDMAERLDRELTSIIYGQTSTLLCFKRANRYFHWRTRRRMRLACGNCWLQREGSMGWR